MKFQYLEIGQRFEFEGKEYVKEGPVAARELASGKTRMIPRYAVLTPIETTANESNHKRNKPLQPKAIRTAFDHFYAECIEMLGPDVSAETIHRLEAARQRFLDGL